MGVCVGVRAGLWCLCVLSPWRVHTLHRPGLHTPQSAPTPRACVSGEVLPHNTRRGERRHDAIVRHTQPRGCVLTPHPMLLSTHKKKHHKTYSPPPVFRVQIDKGFRKSHHSDAFICQKKNHFQVCCCCCCCNCSLPHTSAPVLGSALPHGGVLSSSVLLLLQVTIALQVAAEPAYIATHNGMLRVSGLFLLLHGQKLEAPNGKVRPMHT